MLVHAPNVLMGGTPKGRIVAVRTSWALLATRRAWPGIN